MGTCWFSILVACLLCCVFNTYHTLKTGALYMNAQICFKDESIRSLSFGRYCIDLFACILRSNLLLLSIVEIQSSQLCRRYKSVYSLALLPAVPRNALHEASLNCVSRDSNKILQIIFRLYNKTPASPNDASTHQRKVALPGNAFRRHRKLRHSHCGQSPFHHGGL